jgi:glycosyltransferase involved in cell wall biosynthesis
MNETILYLFIIVACIRWLIYVTLAGRILTYKPKQHYKSAEGVSIIVIAKNEETNLSKLIPILINQEYPEFEVIVADDFSSDDTWKVIQSFNDGKLKPTKVDKDQPGKKIGLTHAINQAKYDILLFTDADCIPASKNWIQEMASKSEGDHKDIVLGLSPMVKVNHPLGLLSRFETLHTALLYLASALFGHTYMGVGRNLMYRKSLFKKVDGFKGHDQIPSGDDDLQIQKMANKSNVGVCIAQNSWVYTQPKTNLRDYINQKSRHIGVANFYQWKYKISLMFISILQTLFYGLLMLNLILDWKNTLIYYFIWAFGTIFILLPLSKKWSDLTLSMGFPLFDLCFTILNPIFLVYGKFKKGKW